MAKKQSQSKKYKALMRSGRFKVRNAAERPSRVSKSRKRHIKNALRSCGMEFAQNLKEYYSGIPVPSKKVE
jgi:hypothetical protein